jgi:hypothetical protein
MVGDENIFKHLGETSYSGINFRYINEQLSKDATIDAPGLILEKLKWTLARSEHVSAEGELDLHRIIT